MASGLVALVVAATALAACSDDGSDRSGAGDGTRESNGSATGPCTPGTDEKPAKALLRCGRDTIAYVETDYASGTGVLVERDGDVYVVTNQHVVDPYDAADVTIGGNTEAGVPLVGVDTAADIALLGPLEGDHETLELAAEDDVEAGDDVFLVGFPGEVSSDEHDLTIASGIVSRHRDVEDFDQSYVQTDAAIAGGQSGGPLFDASGRLVGISGLSFTEEFGLALSSADVRAAVNRILDGEGDDVLAVPADVGARGATTSGTVDLTDPTDVGSLYLPPSDEDRTWELSVPAAAGADVVVDVWDFVSEEPIAVSASVGPASERAVAAARELGADEEMLADFAAFVNAVPAEARALETSPGVFRIPVEAGDSAEVDLYAAAGPVADVAWTSNLPLWPLNRTISSEELAVGETAEGVIGSFDAGRDFLVELEAGQEVEIWARSPQGDLDVEVFEPGVAHGPAAAVDPTVEPGIELFDDSDAGLFGLDVRERYTAGQAGTYRVRIINYEAAPTAFRLTVTDCASRRDCPDS